MKAELHRRTTSGGTAIALRVGCQRDRATSILLIGGQNGHDDRSADNDGINMGAH